jgi:hypothetical protein
MLSIVALAATAQLELKPSVGFNVAKFDSDPVFEIQDDSLVTNGRFGYQLGASLAIGRKLYVEPGVFYAKLSQNMQPTNADIKSELPEFTYSVSFVRVPVNFGFQFIGHNTSFAGLRIFLGPSMLIPLSVKENDYPIVKDDLKSPQFDFNVGAGLNLWFIFLDVSYGWGLTQQFNDDPITAKMQAFYANLGFRFKLKSDE